MRKNVLMIGVLLVMLLAAAIPATGQDDDADYGACGDPATFIHEVQGSGEQTGLSGDQVTIEGVVVGDFQDRNREFGGFYIQEEAADADDDPTTSEGVFVDSLLKPLDVSVGDVVRLTGVAFEVADSGGYLTTVRRLKALEVCSSGAEIEPTEVTLPVDEVATWERYEGMLVTLPQELTVTQLYNLGRYGEVMVSVDGRLFQPTNVARPGEDAMAVAAENDRRYIVLDDGNDEQNHDPTLLPAGGLSATNILRSGYTVSDVTGVVDQRYGMYLIQLVEVPEFVDSNPRTTAPEDVGGRLRVASFNVLNYFNGDGQGGGFPTERGADNAEELTRQRDKLISALLGLDADVIGLMEIENDGDGPHSAVADLVAGLNEVAGEGTYAYIPDADGQPMPGEVEGEGGDAIKQAIIYRPAAVTPVGDPVTTLDAPFDIRRPPAGQAFEEIATGERFIVVVNHFKSKGCTGAGVDPDTGDGQGCWNLERVQAAETVVAWLESDPTGTGETDALVIGDLNAYAMEDPVAAFEAAGYVNVVRALSGTDDYSYIYSGLAGSLDHALASPSLVEQVTGADHWHINADEPTYMDYNTEYKSDNHIESLYDAGPYRASDHDPVVVGLALGGEALPEATEAPEATATLEATEVPDTPEPTDAPADTAVPEATDTPEAEEDDADQSDDSGGMLAIIVGLVAVLVAMVGGWMFQRNKSK